MTTQAPACAVPWCVAVPAAPSATRCIVHEHQRDHRLLYSRWILEPKIGVAAAAEYERREKNRH